MPAADPVASVRPVDSLSTLILPVCSSRDRAAETASRAAPVPLRRSSSVLCRASAASWTWTRRQVSAKKAWSQSSRRRRTHTRTEAGSASSCRVKSSCLGPLAVAISTARARVRASVSGEGAPVSYRLEQVNSRAAETNRSSSSLSRTSRSSASVEPVLPSPPWTPANGMKMSEKVFRHRNSASCSRSARSGSRAAEVAVVQPCRPGWCPGSERAWSASPSSARGEVSKTMRSGGRPAMSMCTLTPPWCGVPGWIRASLDCGRQSTGGPAGPEPGWIHGHRSAVHARQLPGRPAR